MTIRLLVLAAVLLTAVPVSAQDPAAPPSGGNGTASAPDNGGNTRQVVLDALGAVLTGPSWNAGISVFGGYNQTNISQASTGSSTLNSFIRSGAMAGATAQLGTSFGRGKSSYTLSGGTAANYFRATNRFITSYHAQSSQSFRIGSRSNFSAGQSFGVAPYYAIGQFQGLQTFAGTQLSVPVQPGVGTAVGDMWHYRYGASAAYSHPITDRTSFSAQYSAGATALISAKPLYVDQSASARVSRTLKKSVGVHAGYGYSLMSFRTTGQAQGFHRLDIGLDLNRGLSLTRRTRLNFGTGTTMHRSVAPIGQQPVGPATPPTGTSSNRPSHLNFALTGNVTLSHDFGRSWIAQTHYGRTWQVVDGTYVPFLGNTITGGISGQLSSSMSVGSSVSYMLRDQQISQTTNQNLPRGNALAANAFLSIRIRRSISGFLQYGYYNQSLDLSQLGLNLPSTFNRHSARAGLTIAFRSR